MHAQDPCDFNIIGGCCSPSILLLLISHPDGSGCIIGVGPKGGCGWIIGVELG